MATITEPRRDGEWVIAEEVGSRENVQLARSLTPYASGTMLVRSDTDEVAVGAAATNTGDGDFAETPVALATAYPGDYQLEITAAEVTPIVVSAEPDAANGGDATINATAADLFTGQTGVYVIEITDAPIAASATAVADPANTGDGAMGEVTLAAGAQAGDYIVEITAEAGNGGTFSVTDPLGAAVGNGTVGVAFNDEIAFTLADGAEDFDTGDKWTVTVVLAAPAEFSVIDPSDAPIGTGVEGVEFDGEITFTITPGATPSEVGDAFAVAITAGSPATFDLTRPDGSPVGHGLRGVPFATELAFTLDEGNVPWAMGDTLLVTVGAGDGVHRPYQQGSRADGALTAAGVLVNHNLNADGTGAGTAIVRKAVLDASEMPAVPDHDLTDPADALVGELRALGIVIRASL